jgi:hypothetical protein
VTHVYTVNRWERRGSVTSCITNLAQSNSINTVNLIFVFVFSFNFQEYMIMIYLFAFDVINNIVCCVD